MQFRELLLVASNVHFTCFIFREGKFRQWSPIRPAKGMNKLDQLGSELLKSKASVISMRVHRVHPTASNYMNVYLF